MRPSIGIGELMVALCVTFLHIACSKSSRLTYGQAELNRLMPEEVGAAAAYEAWRQFRQTLSHYDYLDPYDRRLDAMHGVAVAEGAYLLLNGVHIQSDGPCSRPPLARHGSCLRPIRQSGRGRIRSGHCRPYPEAEDGRRPQCPSSRRHSGRCILPWAAQFGLRVRRCGRALHAWTKPFADASQCALLRRQRRVWLCEQRVWWRRLRLRRRLCYGYPDDSRCTNQFFAIRLRLQHSDGQRKPYVGHAHAYADWLLTTWCRGRISVERDGAIRVGLRRRRSGSLRRRCPDGLSL